MKSLALLLVFLGYASAASCPKYFTFDGDDMCYVTLPGPYTYESAQAHCSELGGSVATLKSEYQWNAFKAFTAIGTTYFTSANQQNNSVFTWPDGSVVNKKYFAPGQPISSSGSCTSYSSGNVSGLSADDCGTLRIGRGVICQTNPHAECLPEKINNVQHGTITSDNYPFHYFNDMNCTYTLTASTDEVVTLVFTDFQVEEPWDHVNVYSGATVISNLLTTIIASTPNKTAQSSENVMTVQFVTDDDTMKTGWSADYFMGKAPTPITLSGSSGTIASPNYPSEYPTHTTQTYHFNVNNENYHYVLNFTNFYTYKDDHVYIYEGKPLALKKTISGLFTVPTYYTTATSNVMVIFNTGSQAGFTGWNLYYTLTQN